MSKFYSWLLSGKFEIVSKYRHCFYKVHCRVFVFLFRRLFITDYGYPPKIVSANLDGSDLKDIYTTDLIFPTGIVADYLNERLYFVDTKRHTVETMRYDGSDHNIVKTFDGGFKFLVF